MFWLAKRRIQPPLALRLLSGRRPTRARGSAPKSPAAGDWWSWGDLNPRPLACHASALPTELQPRDRSDGTRGPFGAGNGRLPFDAGGVAPQTFEAVVIAGLGLEDVHQQVAEIEKHPLPLGPTLFPNPFATDLGEFSADALGQSLDMGAGGPGGEHESVGDDRERRNVEKDDVEPLLVGEGVGCSPSQVLNIDCSPPAIRVDPYQR